ncbi:GTP pyrophosphokinase [Clostridium chromiireducens]|uniref:GTP pyrophosphokinase n=1 Tax=Clostridium chromiireducens TaxID=225345 RepID=A0A964RIF2_9CLOT|nr:RelA/SpoT domain-containing protein [Clostridium chromiireducens]MVX62206.1 GTP pyrophosphokinase [Clostridium chromiireducens]
MKKSFNIDEFLKKYPYAKEAISKNDININNLKEIYEDYIDYKSSYENQAEFIANILRAKRMVHSVKSRIKDANGLIEKVIRKTEDRRSKYGSDFEFTVNNYKNEINDLIGIRVIHIFKDQWQEIHNFIVKTWRVIEITANVREGDNIDVFDDPSIEVRSKASGYRSVHYLVELNFTQSEPTIAEIQVRTIFEEGYGEIDHLIRYSSSDIPELVKANLLLFNRIVGSADEMVSLISKLSDNLTDNNKYEDIIKKQNIEIERLRNKTK